MKIKLLSSESVSTIFEFVTMINKSNNMTASVLEKSDPEQNHFVIVVESLYEEEDYYDEDED